MSVLLLYVVLLRATMLSFSGFASVPLVREDLVVQRAVLTDTELNDAIAVSQASPGPLGAYVVVVGYVVAGLPGAAAAALALASPAVLAIPIAFAVRRGNSRRMRGAASGIVIASCVLMLGTSARLAAEAAPTVALAGVSVVGFLAMALRQVPPVVAIFGCAAAGIFLVG